MSNAAALAMAERVERAFAHKPEELQHIYIDTECNVRDRYIEEMFQILFRGEEIDEEVFQNNFSCYFDALAVRLLPRSMAVGPEIFGDYGLARAWVTYNFGLIHVAAVPFEDAILRNPTFEHCRFKAVLRTRLGSGLGMACYAPTELHATLLTVVNVFRELANQYHQELIDREA